MPSVSTKLPGAFSLLNDANGSQVAHNGHPLYTYLGVSAPEQANGHDNTSREYAYTRWVLPSALILPACKYVLTQQLPR